MKNQNCAYDEVIKLETECRAASEFLGLYFTSEFTSTKHPAGCHYSTNHQKSYFNQILVIANTLPGFWGYHAGVCKKKGNQRNQ